MNRLLTLLLVLPLFAGCGEGPFTDMDADSDRPASSTLDASQRASFPDLIPLPTGFQPEGIAIGAGTQFYVGSLDDGSIYKGDLRTGAGSRLVDPQTGRFAVGIDVDRGNERVWVAGGAMGQAYLYDAETGEDLGAYDFDGGFVNDVIVTRTGAYFTDSFEPVLYRVPLGPGGQPADSYEEVPLGGDFEFISSPGTFNANGITAPPRGTPLIVVNSTTGELYTVDPETGNASLIDLGTASVPAGDGLVLDGNGTLYVVQNRFNQIAVGELVDVITDSAFDVPTTAARFNSALYAVNARFGTPDPQLLEYSIVRVQK